MQLDKKHYTAEQEDNIDFVAKCEQAPDIRYPITFNKSPQVVHNALSHLRSRAIAAAIAVYPNVTSCIKQEFLTTYTYRRPDGNLGLVRCVADVESDLEFSKEYDETGNLKEQTQRYLELADKIEDLTALINRPWWKKLLGVK